MPSIEPDALEIRGPRTRAEVEAVADLYGKGFGDYPHLYSSYVDRLSRRLPREQWHLSRTMWMPDGTPIAHVRVCHRVMRLGAAMVRVGGIGDVCTHPSHLKRGLMRHLFTHVVEFMGQEDYDLSILWGIGNFYDKFGYIVALTDGTLQCRRRQVARTKGPYRGRRGKLADAKAVRRLFEADLATRDGGMERPDDHWLRRNLCGKAIRVLADPKGRPRAYYEASPDGDALVLHEVSLGRRPGEPAIRSVVADMVRVAKTHEKPNLRFALPPTHPIGQFLRADGCEIRRTIGHRGGAMARITNLQTLCTRMAPEWNRLLAASPAATHTGRLRLKTDMGTIDLAIADATVTPSPPRGRAAATIAADQDKLTRLLLGFHTPETSLFLGETRITKPALPLAQTLFPPRDLLIFGADHF